MVSTSSGTQIQDDSTTGSEASQSTKADAPSSAKSKASEPGLAVGCFILIRSIFTMPINTAKLAGDELRKIAKAGAIDKDKDFPHLFWCKAMLPVVATFLAALVFLGTFGITIAERGIAGLILGLIAAPVAAILTDWFIMIFGEYLMIKVVSVRYYKQQIKAHDSESEHD
ncbi:hypothetical protein [Sphingorhabdus sp. Alg231-15]|uniref:hypothetical protein n=1 Tax=Sphingorhabdus sp. Alg231-15 TaxID=1922222 RepID=UPI000D55D10C